MTERENMLMVLNHEQPEWVPNFGKASRFYFGYGCDRVLNPRTGYYYDRFGVEFELEKGPLGGYMPTNTKTRKFELEDITEWKAVMPEVDLGKVDWEEETRKMAGNDITLFYTTGSREYVSNYIVGYLWDELHYMMGFENALYSIAAEPEAAADFLNAMADFYIDCMLEQFKYWKPDIAMTMDHVANESGLLISPSSYRNIIKPAQKKIFDVLKDQNIMVEMHVDGKIDDIIPDYAEIGVQVIQPFQVYNDIEKAKKDYNMIAIGGWDAFGPGNQDDASEETVRASVRKAIDTYAPTGNYAIWFSGASATSKEKMFWLNDEAEKYGHAFYK
ncbi:MAG: uroporphyrinogen decarboxylase family protein [Lachnospiraceae bacterium]|nr:uroporphyrinogen decarboxylase family protein [Lachnospiraceae bacterium]